MRILVCGSTKSGCVSVWKSKGTGTVDVTTEFGWVDNDLTSTVGSTWVGWPSIQSFDSISGLKEKLIRIPGHLDEVVLV